MTNSNNTTTTTTTTTATATTAVTATMASPASATTMGGSNVFMPIKDILAQKLTMFNYKLPSDRTMYESSLIYCNLCDYSCDLTDKSAIICHYISKHPEDNIVYSYLWPQFEATANPATVSGVQYKIKYYLIKAHLKVRNKEAASTSTLANTSMSNLSELNYPNTLLTSEEASMSWLAEDDEKSCRFVMDKLVDWVDKNLTTSGGAGGSAAVATASAAAAAQSQDQYVQELEEEQEVQEVEMSGEDVYDPTNILAAHSDQLNEPNAATSLTDLIRLTSSALFYSNQQKILNNSPVAIHLDNNFLVHLLAINKNENVFRIKQIHDYYGGCFVCGKQVEFNMKHYQVTIFIPNFSINHSLVVHYDFLQFGRLTFYSSRRV